MSGYYCDRAKRGAAWLDKQFPGWFKRVNPLYLDISSPHYCVVGQLFGNYNEDWYKKVAYSFQYSHGFHIRVMKDKNWKKQTDAWKKEISYRRQAA